MHTVDPTPDRLAEFLDAAEPEGKLVMLNLLRFRDQAEYPPDAGIEAEPCSGRDCYQQRYGAVALEYVRAAGGRVLWMGNAWFGVIAPDDEPWDEILLVEYPSRQAFLEMVATPEYRAAAIHRSAALRDSRLIASTTVMRNRDP